nr:MAG TPA: Protein of unknown function (DUF1043) [Caudoviricetes sp.]
MIVGIIFGIVCVVSISNAVRKYKKDEAEALRNECAHHIHDRNTHHIHDR